MIRIHVFNTHRKYRIHKRETIGLSQRVLKGERRTRAEIAIVFIADKRMMSLNTEYLGHPYATDVLSFRLSEHKDQSLEGEVYVNLDQARRQAGEYGETIKNEVARLVVHGILHLTGLDDRTKRKKDYMTRMENRYLMKKTYVQEGIGNG